MAADARALGNTHLPWLAYFVGLIHDERHPLPMPVCTSMIRFRVARAYAS